MQNIYNHHDQIFHLSPELTADPPDLTVGSVINVHLIQENRRLTGLTTTFIVDLTL